MQPQLLRQVAAAVQQNAGTHHVHICLRVRRHAAGVGTVAYDKPLSALCFHRVDDPAEQRQLFFRIVAAVRIRLVRHGKMGKDSLRPQTRQGAGRADIRRAGVEVSTGDQISQPRHTGVYLDVHRQLAAAAHRLLAVLQRLGLAGHRLGNVQIDEPSHLLTGRVAQDQDGHGDAVAPQLRRLVYAGHRQVIRAQRLQGPAHLHGPVAVGIRLHHTQKLHLRAHPVTQRPIVVRQRVQVDLRPCSPQCRFHCYASVSPVVQAKDIIRTVRTTFPFCENSAYRGIRLLSSSHTLHSTAAPLCPVVSSVRRRHGVSSNGSVPCSFR